MPISLLFIFLFLHQSSSASPPPPTTTDFEFIHESCNSTLYPDICYHSLSRYAFAISNSSSKLASAAISVSLSRALRLSTYFSSLHNSSSSSSCSPRAAAALADCNSVFSDAVFQIRGSLAQMRRLPPIPAAEVRFQVANVQTWMSAALTYEDTCTDGFQGVTDLRLKSDVCGRVTKVAKVTSNALALVNRYAVSSTLLD